MRHDLHRHDAAAGRHPAGRRADHPSPPGRARSRGCARPRRGARPGPCAGAPAGLAPGAPGFAAASYEPVAGWRIAIAKRKLATPVKTDEGHTLTEEVDKLTFTATGKGIAPGQFQDFGLSVGLPDKPAGTKLTFKALQTYAGGDVVRWIGAPDSEHPAPQVTLVAADEPAAAAAPAGAAASDEEDGDGDGNGLAIVALIVGALGLLAGAAALVRARG